MRFKINDILIDKELSRIEYTVVDILDKRNYQLEYLDDQNVPRKVIRSIEFIDDHLDFTFKCKLDILINSIK